MEKTKETASVGKIRPFVFAGVVIAAALNTFSVYAKTPDVQKFSDAGTYQLTEINGYEYVTKNGNPIYGYTYDDNGNIYYTDFGSKTGILKNQKSHIGLSFDENGILIVPGYKYDEETYKGAAKTLEDGRSYNIAGRDMVEDFCEYYNKQYRLYNHMNVDFSIRNDVYELIDMGTKYEREALRKRILSEFGSLSGATVYDKVLDGCKKINARLTYNAAYRERPLPDALDANQGVCWQFAKILGVLLEDAGIESEQIYGKYHYTTKKSDTHEWIRYRDGDTWHYADPTITDGDWDYADIPYGTYVKKYTQLLSCTFH